MRETEKRKIVEIILSSLTEISVKNNFSFIEYGANSINPDTIDIVMTTGLIFSRYLKSLSMDREKFIDCPLYLVISF